MLEVNKKLDLSQKNISIKSLHGLVDLFTNDK